MSASSAPPSTPTAESDLLPLLSTVLGAFHQTPDKAQLWADGLKDLWMLSKRDLINMLRLDRSEKAAGRDAGAEAWSNAIGALQSAGIPKSAWAMIEGRLVLELDKDSAGTGDTFLTPPQPPQNKPNAGARVPHLVDAVALPWTTFKESELGPRKDKSGWREFSNLEHANVFRFKRQWGESAKQARCEEVAKRWNIRQAPSIMLKDLQGPNGASGLKHDLKVFLHGPARKPSGWMPPTLTQDRDREKASAFAEKLRVLSQKKASALVEVESLLSEAQTPVWVRQFELIRAGNAPPSDLKYKDKPDGYVLRYTGGGGTLGGSPSKRPKVMMTDERFQNILTKAMQEWDRVEPVLNSLYQDVQNFLNPDPAQANTSPRSESGVNVTLMRPKIRRREQSQRAQPQRGANAQWLAGWREQSANKSAGHP
jgi:hypothetical protein